MSEAKSMTARLAAASEEKLQEMADELLSNPRFAEAIGRTLRGAQQTKGKLDRNIRLLLNTVNVPAKADYDDLVRKVTKLGDSMTKLETRIDGLVARLEKVTATLAKR